MLLPASAAFVGLVHSLAPGHWLPVVLMTKTRHWPAGKAVVGALVAASGHILVSLALGGVGLKIGAQLVTDREHLIERYSGLGLMAFGIGYSVLALLRHRSCSGHEHHGPSPTKKSRGPYLFLFMVGFSPCVAVLPLFAAAAPVGTGVLAMTMAGFAAGVLLSLVGATLMVSRGIMKLDHPVFEHYGDLITGLGVALMGFIMFWVS